MLNHFTFPLTIVCPFFNGEGTIFNINENLKKIWEVNHYTKKEKKLNPILYFAQNGKNLIVVDNISKFYSLNLKNGDLIWSKSNQAPFNSNVKIYIDRFMAIDFDNVIRCFSVENRREIWNFKTEDSFIKSQKKLSLALKGEVVYFINNLGDVTALSIDDGSLIWQTPTQSNVIYQNAFSLENSDLVGLDLTLDIHKYLFSELDISTGPQTLLQNKVRAGELGMSVGQGFRSWTPEKVKETKLRMSQYLVKAAKERRDK